MEAGLCLAKWRHPLCRVCGDPRGAPEHIQPVEHNRDPAWLPGIKFRVYTRFGYTPAVRPAETIGT